MNEIIKAIKERRSIRKFKPDMPPEAILSKLSKLDFMPQTEWGSRLSLPLP